MLLLIRSEILHAFVRLSESSGPHRRLYAFEEKVAGLIESAFSPALTRLARFSVECNELDTLTHHSSRRSKATDVYDLLSQIRRVRLEDAVLAKSSPSSILKSNSLDDTSFTASVALATAEWDNVIQQAWRLNIEAMNRYEELTLAWRKRVLYFSNNQKKRLDLQ